jgi:metallo-beta-lactamase class B
VALGGATLIARRTGGHTPGATTWTMKAAENGKTYDVLLFTSLRPPVVLTPPVIADFKRSFDLVRSLPCDVPLGDHPSEYRMQEKYAKLAPGAPNPFIDREGCHLEADIQEAMFHAILA